MRTWKPAGFLLLLIVGVYGDILFFGRGFYLQDVLSYHIPMKWVVRTIVLRGEFPFWNPYYSAGQPLAANPAYEVFYPPQWLTFLPYHFGFQLHIVVHFLIAAFGTYLLLRGLKGSPVAATFGAAVFVMSGPYLSLASRLPLLFSLSWMPWVLEFARRTIETRSRRDFGIAAFAAAMQLIIGEPTIIIQTWLIVAGYAMWRRKWREFGAVALIGVAAALIAAVQLVPALDFARDSVRSEPFDFRIVGNWSMPFVRPVEMALPGVFRNITVNGATAISTMYPYRTDAFLSELYVGVFVVILAIAGFLSGARGAGAALLAIAISFLIAAGDHTPLLKLLYDVRLFRSIRYPEKFVLAGAFVLIVWSALLFDRLRERKFARTAMIAGAIWLGVMLIAFASGSAYFGQQCIRAAIALAVLALVRKPNVAIVAVFAFVLADLWLATQRVVPRMPREFFDPPPIAGSIIASRIFPEAYWQEYEHSPDALGWIQNRPEETYWWMERNSMADHLPARWNYPLILEDDVDRTSLKTTDTLREAMKSLRARHVIAAEEPFLKISGASAALRFLPPQRAATTHTTMVEAVRRDYPAYVFADRIVRDDAIANIDLERGLQTVAFADVEPFAPARGQVVEIRERANHIQLGVRAEGKAFLAMSVTAHRYWSATIDGKPATLIPTNAAYQGLVVPAGAHTIEMRYRNPWVLPSGIVSLLAIAAIAAAAGTKRDSSARV